MNFKSRPPLQALLGFRVDRPTAAEFLIRPAHRMIFPHESMPAMKLTPSKCRLRVIAAMVFSAVPALTSAANWTGHTVGQLQSTYDGADCVYFTLEGVAEADPVKPGDPWFAIPRTQYGAKDAYAMLLAAKLTGKTVFVSTRGTLSCGYAAVSQVLMQ